MRILDGSLACRSGEFVLALTLFCCSARAQGTGIVSGVVRDSLERPLSANVVIEASRRTEALPPGSAFRTVVTAGSARIHVRMLGYLPLDTAVNVRRGEETRLVLTMRRALQELDTIRVVARGCDPHRFEGFKCRRATTNGTFLDQAAIDSAHQSFVGGLFDDVPGFRVGQVKHNLIAVPTTGWRCIVPLIDGLPQRWDGISWYPEIPTSPRDIIALEAYAAAADVPNEYQQYTWKGGQRCSVVVYWTSGRVRKVP